jgi:nicotinamidase-related amidase
MIGLLVVDMNHAFVDPASPLCVAGALESVPRIERVLGACRGAGVPIFFITRAYREDGSDVEISRFAFWAEHGRPMSERSAGPNTGDFYGPLQPRPGEYVLRKTRWSAFCRTELDLLLRRRGVDTVVLTGTQTPNCIRATAFDADANDFATVVIADATSSKTPEVQAANLRDLRSVGFEVLSTEEFVRRIPEFQRPHPIVERIAAELRALGTVRGEGSAPRSLGRPSRRPRGPARRGR